MFKRKKITIIIALIFLFNIFMICLGVFLQAGRYQEMKDEIVNDLESKLFVDVVTEGRTNDFEEFESMLDGHYVDSEGNEQVGIEIDEEGNYISDSGDYTRNSFTNYFISNTLNWEDLSYMLNTLVQFDISVIQSKGAAIFLLTIDKGGDAAVWSEALTPILTNFTNMSDTAISAALTAASPILSALLPYGLEGFGIELFSFTDEFTYSENINGEVVEVTYDFSGNVTKEQLKGDGTTMLGIQNWTTKETNEFFNTLSFFADASHEGDYHQSMNITKGLSTTTNTFYIIDKFMSSSLEEYKGKSYQLFKPVWNESTKDTWSLQWRKTVSVDSAGEALLYAIYDKVDYTKYYDRAMELDGVVETGYRIEFASELYYNSQYTSDKYGGTEGVIEPVLYEYGQEEVDFSTFVLLSKTYKPILRSVNYEDFITEMAEIMTEGINLSELPNIK